MSINDKYIDPFVLTTERAAYGASLFVGKNDKIAADQASVDEMRNQLNKIPRVCFKGQALGLPF